MSDKIDVCTHPAPSPMPGTFVQSEWRRSASGFVVDLDGTLLLGDSLAAGAAELIDHLGQKFVLASNNSTHTSAGLAAELSRIGLAVAPERLVLAGEMTVSLTALKWPGARVSLFSTSAIRDLALDAGLRLVDRDPDVIVLARDPSFDVEKLSFAANAVRAGGRLVVANPDTSHPGPGGTLVPETGCLMKAVLACTGTVPDLIVGKPHPFLFHEALDRLDTAPGETVVLGDNPATDAAGALALGMRYLLVGGNGRPSLMTPRDLLAYTGPALATAPESDGSDTDLLKCA